MYERKKRIVSSFERIVVDKGASRTDITSSTNIVNGAFVNLNLRFVQYFHE